METVYDLVETVVAAHQLGKREGFETALDVRALIEEDFASDPSAFNNDGFADADAVYLEALAAKQQELEGRLQLIEQHYLGVDFTPEASDSPGRFGDLRYAAPGACDDSNCDCGDVHH